MPNGQTNEKGAATMQLTITENVSVDGVMQGLGGPDEDRRGRFERGRRRISHGSTDAAGQRELLHPLH